ncbi:MAG: hypothetical protein K5681_05270 [Treponema sp.]|nr:hypothetical protein [Treponema sp.]
MKKFFLNLIICLSATLFSSCANLYKCTGEVDWVKEKTSMKPFSHLNTPIVITVDLYDKYSLFGKKNSPFEWVDAGDIFVVYDWENDRIFDWAFFEDGTGLSNFRCAELGNNPTKYYDASRSSKKIGELNPETGMISIYDSVNVNYPGIVISMNNNNKEKCRYGLINDYSYNYDLDCSNEDFYILDSVTKKVSSVPIHIPTNTVGDVFFPFADSNGHYWLSNRLKGYIHFYELLPETVEIGHDEVLCEMSEESIMKLCLVSDDYLLFRECFEPFSEYIYYVEKNNLSQGYKKLRNPMYNTKDVYPYIGVECEGKCYLILCTSLSDKFYIHYCDIEKGTLVEEAQGNFNLTETLYVRDSRIYFINSSNLENFVFTYYDTLTKKWGDAQTVTCQEIVNGNY